MATWGDVRRIAMSLPAVEELESRGLRRWQVRGKLFVWERPLRRPDLAYLGADAPTGPVLGARVASLEEKAAILASDAKLFFTTPHFDGYPAILLRLAASSRADLEATIVRAWMARAPVKLVNEMLGR